MSREEKLIAIMNIISQRTYPKEQFGFDTIEMMADDILKAIGE